MSKEQEFPAELLERVARAMTTVRLTPVEWAHLVPEATVALRALRDAGALVGPGWVAVPRGVLESLCADAETLVRHNCGEPPHPALKRRYDRDMADIIEARRLLAAAPRAGGGDE